MNFESLRKKHAQFIYEGFNILHEDGNLKIVFDFLLMPDIRFRPFVVFPKVSTERLNKIGPEVLQNLAFNLGIIELISYWKAACPPQIIIKAGFLDEKQIFFWKKLLNKGLGEFFYNNKIDFTKEDLVEFKVANTSYLRGRSEATPRVLKDRDLVLVGGGKDSAVTLESISQKRKEFNCLILNPTNAAIKIAEAGGCKNPIIIKRTISPKLLELNKLPRTESPRFSPLSLQEAAENLNLVCHHAPRKTVIALSIQPQSKRLGFSASDYKRSYLNGHTPFSAYLAFLATFAGVLYDYKNVIVSNGVSSNEGNVIWLGQEINHQYSKSFEFEKDFRNYSNKYLTHSVNYFSFLRSLGELQITELFSKMNKYHKLFRSCNRGSKQGVWCGECPKCVSTYLLLYPFLGEKTEKIFGKNLLEDKSLIPVVKSLLRENGEVKPFECVATVEEIKVAIYLGIQYSKSEGKRVPLVLQRLAQHGSDGENK